MKRSSRELNHRPKRYACQCAGTGLPFVKPNVHCTLERKAAPRTASDLKNRGEEPKRSLRPTLLRRRSAKIAFACCRTAPGGACQPAVDDYFYHQESGPRRGKGKSK